jgi:isopentenyl-diphosphate Delta-isomerase
MIARESIMDDYVILVDERDAEVGTAAKLDVHVRPRLHRAFSIFVFNDREELLLQQRAPQKYHSGGLWSNTCCGHPRPGERTDDAAHRRLWEEMRFACDLDDVFSFVYHSSLDGGLAEWEYDHVFVGRFSGQPRPDPDEVAAHAWLPAEALMARVEQQPASFTVWLRASLPDVIRTQAYRSTDGNVLGSLTRRS